MSRADRLFGLVNLLSGVRRRTLAEIAETLSVSPRTIYRDLADLETRGVAIERVEGTYRLMDGATMRPLKLTPHERLLLDLMLENPAVAGQEAFRGDVQQLRLKLFAASGGSGEELQAAILAGPDRSGPIARETFDELTGAIRDRRSLSILYASLSAAKPEWRGVDPWALFHRSEAWYLAGRCHVHDEPRTYRLDRIRGVLAIGRSFERPPEFDLEQWLDSRWGIFEGDATAESVILFDASLAPLIEYATHHPTETKRRLEDGSVEYRVRVGHLEELARWIAGFAGAARAVAPPELVAAVRTIAAGALDAHAERKPAKRSARDHPRRARRSAS